MIMMYLFCLNYLMMCVSCIEKIWIDVYYH